MTLKNEIEKTMFKEGIEDRIQDIATFMDISVEIVKKRLKTLSFSDESISVAWLLVKILSMIVAVVAVMRVGRFIRGE